MLAEDDFDGLCRHLYRSLRDGTADREAAFDLSADILALSPADGQDPVTALVEVADSAQDTVMHSVWGAWPTGPEHRNSVHAREYDGAAVWWCASGGGHAVARVGRWPRLEAGPSGYRGQESGSSPTENGR